MGGAGHSGFSILPKDTSACRWVILGIELPTFRLEDDHSTPQPQPPMKYKKHMKYMKYKKHMKYMKYSISCIQMRCNGLIQGRVSIWMKKRTTCETSGSKVHVFESRASFLFQFPWRP
ncbi:unnamed protein product [Pleuronectes platessa]|uniref:Uncharacterized protein n=1 Tax=Pleuronectes platessa TaxID=8262 RepID=A0A9N7UCP1_PLEPL|nr:unnamed protein product [Pleuronectes platessa]